MHGIACEQPGDGDRAEDVDLELPAEEESRRTTDAARRARDEDRQSLLLVHDCSYASIRSGAAIEQRRFEEAPVAEVTAKVQAIPLRMKAAPR